MGVVDCIINAAAIQGDGGGIMSHYPQKVIIDNVDIISDAYGMWLYAYWDVDNIVLNNIRIKLTGGSMGIWIYPIMPTPIKFSNITISGDAGTAFRFYGNGFVELNNVTVSGQLSPFGFDGGTISVNARHCNFNSTANLIDNGACSPSLDFTIDHSIINNIVTTSASPVRIGNSKITGSILNSNGLVTVVNSYNGNYQLIPNGSY